MNEKQLHAKIIKKYGLNYALSQAVVNTNKLEVLIVDKVNLNLDNEEEIKRAIADVMISMRQLTVYYGNEEISIIMSEKLILLSK